MKITRKVVGLGALVLAFPSVAATIKTQALHFNDGGLFDQIFEAAKR
jgi:hypothetical protein